MLANPAAIRKSYLERMAAFLDGARRDLIAGGVDYASVSTDGALDAAVRDFLVSRAHFDSGGKRVHAVRADG